MRHLSGDAVERYSMGRLDWATAARAEEHLLICHRCRTRLDGFESFLLLLSLEAGQKIPLLQKVLAVATG